MPQGGAGDTQVDFRRAGFAQHADELLGRGPTHDGIVDDHDAFAFDDGLDGGELHPDAGDPEALVGLDEGPARIEILDQPHFEGQAACAGIADSSAETRIGDAEDHVGIDRALPEEDLAGFHAVGMDIDPFDIAVRTREIDVFHRAHAMPSVGGEEGGRDSFRTDFQHFSRLDVPEDLSAHGVQGAGLAGDRIAVTQPSDGQGPESVPVPAGIEPVLGEDEEREGTVDQVQRPFQGVAVQAFLPAGKCVDQVAEDLAVGRGSEQGSRPFQLDFQFFGIDDVSVVDDGEIMVVPVEDEGLDVVQFAAAGGPVPDMADGEAPGMLPEGTDGKNMGNEP